MPEACFPDFVTKSSGIRQQVGNTAMVRDTSGGKPRFDLLIPEGIPYAGQFLTRWALLLERGARLYGERNWEAGEYPEAYDRARESAFRHLMQWMCGETDEDHAAACAFNIAAAEFYRAKTAPGA